MSDYMKDNVYSVEEENDGYVYNIEEEDISANTEEYVLEEEPDRKDSSAEEYVIDDEMPDDDIEVETEEESEAWRGDTCESRPSAFGLLLKVLSNPVDGWKAVKRSKYSVDSFAAGCFYPLLGLAAVSEFTALFYESDSTLSSLLVPAVITFITFFFGYFSVLLFGEFLLPRETRKTLHTYYGKEYVMINMSTLAVFYILFRLFPIVGPILAFLPLWTIYITCKGVKLFRVSPEKETRTCGMLSFLMLGCPIFWNWIFNELLPVEAL